MLSFAALSINRFFTPAPKVKRETPGSRTETLRALSDLGEASLPAYTPFMRKAACICAWRCSPSPKR